MSLKSFLTRLIWICVLPLVMLAAYLAINRVHTLQSQRDQEAANLARNFTTALDRNIDARISALQVLAASAAMGDPHRLSEFYQEAQEFRRIFNNHVVLADLSKHMLLATRVPYGTALPNLPQVKGHSSVSTAMATGKPAAGDIYLGPIAKTPMVSIAVPVIRDGRMSLLLLSVIESHQFQQRLNELAIPPGWSMTVLDGKNEVIASRPPPGMKKRPTGGETPGRFVVKSALSPWSVVLEIPRGIYQEHILAATAALVAAILGATFVSVLGGMLASRRLARSVASLAEPASHLALWPVIAEIETVREMILGATTAREEAESTLRESEERLRLLGDNLPDSYVYQYLHEADGTPRFLYISAGVERLHGMKREDVLRDAGTLHRQTDPEQMLALVAMEAASLRSMADFGMELRMCRTDGEWRWLQVRSRPRRKADGQVLWDGVVMDVTERKRTELAIYEREAKLRRAEEMAHLGHWRYELTTDIVTWSDEMYRIFGLNREEGLFGPTIEEIRRYCHPDDLENCVRSFEPAGQIDGSALEYRVIRPSGEERHVVSNGEVERDENGAPIALFGTLLDTTELRQKERELQEKNVEMERFTYMISHDLKSPLVTVKTFLGYLEQDLANSDAVRIGKDLDFIRTAADRMGRMLDELLELSRVGRMINAPQDCTLQEMAESARDMVAGRIAEYGVEVLVGDVDIALFGDRPRLLEIWQNLVENACKFMGDQAHPRIEIGADRHGGETVFYVRDNGVGIESQYQDRVFGLFEKLDRDSEGTGLGLALVRRIVELNGGEIRVESQGRGQGACFMFTLPGAVKIL